MFADCFITYIKRKIVENFDADFIIYDFYNLKERRARFR